VSVGATRAAAALEAAGLPCVAGAPLASRAYWRLGGPAELYLEVDSLDALVRAVQIARAHAIAVTPLGNGSNLLIADAGVPGLVVRLLGQLRDAEIDEATGVARVGAGLLNAVLLKRLERAGWAGLGCLAGVPGTMGGAVRMNAGTALGVLAEVLIDVQIVDVDGVVRTLPAAALAMRYRWAELPAGAIVASARVHVHRDPDGAERAAVAHHIARRAATQPLDQPSCGSVFKNPPGDFAGRLIEACGLKGTRVGGAQISDKHANFIVNTGGASAADVLALIRAARGAVFARFGVDLEPEVHAAGAWGVDWPLPPAAAHVPSPGAQP
jgi:UDP-N-acetylmuramate dehydrogenase